MRRLLPQSAYARNVLTLMTGTSLAQAIPIAVTPILTRIYSPDEFGLAALYLSCVAVVSLIATGRYELAITLPAAEAEAAQIAKFTLKLCAVISFLFYLPIILMGSLVAQWLGNQELAPWLYLLPVSVMATGSFNVFQFWCNRKAAYKYMAANRVQNTGFSSLSNIILGLMKVPGGIIIGPTLGQVVSAILIGRRFTGEKPQSIPKTRWKNEKEMGWRYIDHPKHIAPAQLLGVVAVQIPVFMIGGAYSLATLGFFSMAYRLVSLPSALIAGAIGDVYRQQISEAYARQGEFRSIFINTLKKTALMAAPPFLLVYLLAPIVFEVVFGSEWREAGEYAQILVIAAFFQFVFTPIDKGAVVVGATRYIFFWHVSRLIGFIGLLGVVNFMGIKMESTLYCFVCLNSALYFVEGVMGYKFSLGVLNGS